MRERGAVSIFIVIFTALLVTIVTTSFVQIMLRNQQQASDNDLSQSAYDSAMAGVEDAKRALVRLKKCQLSPSEECSAFISQLATGPDGWTSGCEVLGAVGIADFQSDKHEVMVGEESLNQAYTCVKIKVKTEDYEGSLSTGHQSVVVPLIPADADTNDIERVRISWFKSDDLPVGQTNPTYNTAPVLIPYSEWDETTPPMMRTQLIQFNRGSINLDEFDEGAARTRLLYPTVIGDRPGSDNFVDDTRRLGPKSLTEGGCRPNFGYGGYACSVEIALPPMPAGETREAYLHLAGIYVKPQGVHYKVEMLGAGVGNIGGRFLFDNVQPEVDSTGRASDLFRRVKANVDVYSDDVPDRYPEAALSAHNICKEFFITNQRGDYEGDGNNISEACTP